MYMKKVAILIEMNAGTLIPADLGMITSIRKEGYSLYAFLLEPVTEEIREQLAKFGIDNLVIIKMDDPSWNPHRWAQAVTAAIKNFDIPILFGLTTAQGRDLLPRIAAMLDAPLVMDCIEVDTERRLAKTSQYSGKTVATLQLNGDCQIYGVRPNITTASPSPVEANTIKFEAKAPMMDIIDLEVVRALPPAAGNQNLAEADVIIAGGRGLKNGKNFKLLHDCAQLIDGAAVGASRVAVDEGWAPYPMQVGQTGIKVNPRVYLACGISGSVQHFAGMKTAEIIIAINLDAEAPIMTNCDYFVQCDIFIILPELIQQLKTASLNKA
jgi:electron transfer flavoprotein alpha subunit